MEQRRGKLAAVLSILVLRVSRSLGAVGCVLAVHGSICGGSYYVAGQVVLRPALRSAAVLATAALG